MNKQIKRFTLALAIAALAGCATVDFDHPKPESHALTDTADTFLGRQLARLPEEHPDMAGFFPLSDGIDALAIRLLMAGRAEVSIDAQYYLIKSDIVGNAFLRNMVRILAGTLVELGRGRFQPAEIKGILESRDRGRAGQTAPAHGLTLVRVIYM